MEDIIIRYKPKKLEEVVGNQHIIGELQTYITRKDFPHYILLYGDYGCGKTTIAQLLVEAIKQCFLASDDGFFPPLCREVDCTSIEERKSVVEFIKTSRYSFASTKILFLDEAHKLGEQQDAFLKPIDKRPDLYLIFATAEADGIHTALASRCRKYKVEKPGPSELKAWITDISAKAKIPLSDDTIERLIRKSNSVPRECLINLGGYPYSLSK